MKLNLEKGCVYQIFWQDIVQTSSEWYSKESFDKILAEESKPFMNVGFYLGSNKQFDFFTTGMSNDNHLFDVIKYPKGIIISVQQLRPV